MIVLDASVLIGYLDGDDAHHAAAREILRAAVDEEFGISTLTLAEVLVAPTRTGRLDAVLEVLRELDVEEIAFSSDAAVRLAELRAITGLKMPDCCVLLSASTAGAAVASLDARLLRAASEQGLPVVSSVPP